MQGKTGLSKKGCLSLAEVRWKYFNCLRTEEDEPIYTYNDNNKILFVRQSKKGGQICAFNQYYISKNCGDVLKKSFQKN